MRLRVAAVASAGTTMITDFLLRVSLPNATAASISCATAHVWRTRGPELVSNSHALSGPAGCELADLQASRPRRHVEQLPWTIGTLFQPERTFAAQQRTSMLMPACCGKLQQPPENGRWLRPIGPDWCGQNNNADSAATCTFHTGLRLSMLRTSKRSRCPGRHKVSP